MKTTTSKVRFNSCFIAAPSTADVLPIWNILEKKRIARVDYYLDSSYGSEPALKVEGAIKRADFVFAILQKGGINKNVYFEIGIAFAKNKPIFLLTETSDDIPAFLKDIFYVQAKPSDFPAITYNLDLFLEHHKKRLKKAKVTRKDKGKELHGVKKEIYFDEFNRGLNEEDLSNRLSRAFTRAGFLVEKEKRISDRRIDMAIWIDQIEASIGNPVFIELKAGALTYNRLKDGISQLHSHLINSKGRLGLLIYRDEGGGKFSFRPSGWPMIVVFEINELINHLTNGTLADYLIAERDRIVHGTS